MGFRTINFLQVLEMIYDGFIENKFLPDALDDEYMSTFVSAYDVTESQAMVLACLAHSFPAGKSARELYMIQSEDSVREAESVLNELSERKFLTRETMSDGNEYYSLSETASAQFKNGQIFGKKLIPDCYKELKNVSLGLLLRDKWKTNFYDSAEAVENRQISEAMATLGVKGWAPEIQDAFWTLVWQFANNFTAPFAFRQSDGPLGDTGYDEERMKKAMGELVKMGLAITIPIEPLEETKDTERYVVAVRVVELLFHGRDEFIRYEEISKQADIITAKDIEEKELFFNGNIQSDVNHLRKLISTEGFKRATEILLKQKRRPGIQSLFWGPPGTGKTEVIKQLARESGRDIVMYNAAKVTASAWGTSEKFYRALFLGYSYLVAVSEKAPILVLNEADQVLSKRLSDVNTAIARSENTISNIVLEGFENMSGILLATTNLASNIDNAFDRRFLFKTELVKPDAGTRRKIWKSSVPELTDEEAGKLAERFEMSGGQISNVVAKRNLAELYYEGDRGFLYIVGLCKDEMMEPIKGSSRKIGF